jgi:hypothetical protein
MEFLQNIINLIQEKMVSLLGEAWMANFIALIMGVFGTFAFFMQLPKKIKPLVMQFGDIIFYITKKTNQNNVWFDLNKIELSISISNLKNAVGIMEDFFVRVYSTDSYNPETVIYFPTKIIIEGNENDYTPFILSPNSHISMKIIFGQVEHRRSEKTITLENNYMIDLYYKIKDTKKPYAIKSILTYNNGKIVDDKLILKNLNMNIVRDKYYKKLKKINTTSYKGIINYFFKNLMSDIRFNFYYTPKKYIVGFFETIIIYLVYVVTNIFAILVSKKIIISEGRKVRKVNISFGNKEHRVIAERTLRKMYSYIEKLIGEINNKMVDEDKVILISQKNSFILQRFGKEINIYMPGDSSIYAQVLKTENPINIQYNIKESKWGIKYWSYNNKFITPYNMTITILNYFILHSLVKR